jgi:hypothetical protein
MLKQIMIAPLQKSAFRNENNTSFGYDLKNGDPMSLQVWHIHVKPSLLKAISAKHRSKGLKPGLHDLALSMG